MINSQLQNPVFRHMVSVIHKGAKPGDTIIITAENQQQAIYKLLETRGLKEMAELLPPVIETKWC